MHPQLILDYFKMIFTYLRFLCCCFLCCTIGIHAQSEFISPKSLNAVNDFVSCYWKTENGLPHNNVLDIHQTKDGFLWISTAGGLCRFDGQQFQVYNRKDAAPIRYMTEDKNGCLWMITSENKLITYWQGRFESITDEVNSVCEGTNGRIYIGKQERLFEFKNKQLLFLINLPGKHIEQLVSGPANQLYILSNKGIDLYYKSILTPIYEKKENDHLLIGKTSEGNIYVVRNIRQLLRITHDQLLSVSDFNVPVSKNQNFSSLFIHTENDFWLGSDEGLLHIRNEQVELLNVTSGLSSNAITSLYMDESKNLWVGTLNEGINKLKRKTIHTYSIEDGLMNDNCGPLLTLPDNSLLISNFCKGINRMKDRKFHEPIQQSGHCIYALFSDRVNDEIWAGTYGSGIHCYKNGKLIRNITTKEGLPNDKIFSIFQDHQNTIWIGTESGLCSYKNGKVNFSVPTAGKVSYICQDSKKRIMFCFDKGIGQLDGTAVKTYAPESSQLTGNIRYLYEDSEGTYWIATYGNGIARLKNDVFFFFPELIDNYASCILEDRSERLWISTNRGIFMGKRSDLNDYADEKTVFLPVQYFGKQDGMLNEECNGGFQYSGVTLDNQHICFPTQNGIAIINPVRAYNPVKSPKLYIQSISVDTTNYFDPDAVKKISNKHQKITFHFTAPFFDDPHNLLFQYKLDGYDANWSSPLHVREANYLNLPPGNYTFRLRIYGNLTEKTITFKIPLPLWKTDLFIYAAVAATLYLFIGIAFYRMKRNQRKEIKKNELVQRYSRLKLSALQTQINPHFMFNCLNSIRYFIEASKKEQATIYLQKFSRLLRLFIEHSRSEFIPVEEEIKLLTLYCELEQLRFNTPFDLVLNVDDQIRNGHVRIPSMIIQHFVENSINHGLKHLERKGTLELHFQLQENILVVHVLDDGVGRSLSEKNNQEKMSGHISRGGQITKERIQLINIIKKMNITVHIADRYPEKDETGTKVIIHIPVKLDTHD